MNRPERIKKEKHGKKMYNGKPKYKDKFNPSPWGSL